jgi:cell division protein FtsQ
MPRETKATAGSEIRRRIRRALIALAIALVVTIIVAWRLRHYLLTNPQFTLAHERRDALTIQGWHYTPVGKVRRVFADDLDHSSFAVPLGERRRRLLGIDWVEDASVSRIWPDRVEVRIRERKPVAFVSFRSGVFLIDSQGVLLDPPAQAQFVFPVLRGVREDESEQQRRRRVRALFRVQEDMGDLFKDISEVDAADPDNVHILVRQNRRAIELILGDTNYQQRYRNFLAHFPEIERHTPGIGLFDLRLDNLITAKE